MTAPVRHQRPMRGRGHWARAAWMLLRIEMGKAREKVQQGEQWGVRTHLLEARALCIQARWFDRHREGVSC